MDTNIVPPKCQTQTSTHNNEKNGQGYGIARARTSIHCEGASERRSSDPQSLSNAPPTKSSPRKRQGATHRLLRKTGYPTIPESSLETSYTYFTPKLWRDPLTVDLRPTLRKKKRDWIGGWPRMNRGDHDTIRTNALARRKPS